MTQGLGARPGRGSQLPSMGSNGSRWRRTSESFRTALARQETVPPPGPPFGGPGTGPVCLTRALLSVRPARAGGQPLQPCPECPLQVESHPGWTSSFTLDGCKDRFPVPTSVQSLRATYPQRMLTYIRWQITYMWLDERLML